MSLKDSFNGGHPGMTLLAGALGRPGAGSPTRTALPPNWQRNLDTVKVESSALTSWSFCAFEACNVDPERVKETIFADDAVSGVPFAMQILADHGLFASLPLEQSATKRYLRAVEGEYIGNYYHNRVHALDVMQSTHAVLRQSPKFEQTLSPLEKLALLLGAYVHDVGHPGFNNKLLTKLANDPSGADRADLAGLALTYNNTANLENFHIATAFKIALDENRQGHNMFTGLLSLNSSSITCRLCLSVDLFFWCEQSREIRVFVPESVSFVGRGRVSM